MGKDYSAAQELMEDEMKEYYSKNPKITPVQTVHVGQLLAVNAEEDAWLRAQIISMDENKIKASTVYFVKALWRGTHYFSNVGVASNIVSFLTPFSFFQKLTR